MVPQLGSSTIFESTLYLRLDCSMVPTWKQTTKKESRIHAVSCRQYELKQHKKGNLNFVIFLFNLVPDTLVKQLYIATLRGFHFSLALKQVENSDYRWSFIWRVKTTFCSAIHSVRISAWAHLAPSHRNETFLPWLQISDWNGSHLILSGQDSFCHSPFTYEPLLSMSETPKSVSEKAVPKVKPLCSKLICTMSRKCSCMQHVSVFSLFE